MKFTALAAAVSFTSVFAAPTPVKRDTLSTVLDLVSGLKSTVTTQFASLSASLSRPYT
jgi:hypothetical protein